MLGVSVAEAPADVMESLSEGRLELPGGLLAGGRRHRHATVRLLTGADEEVLASRTFRNAAVQVTEFLARVVVGLDGLDRPVGRELASELLIGDRDYLVLRIRQMTLGDLVEQVVRCPRPGCGKKADVEFMISELPVRRAEALEAEYEVPLAEPAFADDSSSVSVTLRLPNGADQEAALDAAPNAAAMNTRLYSRIIRRCGRRGGMTEEEARALPLRARHELRQFLQAITPGPDLTVEVQCPHCGEDLSYPFDLQSFFLPAR